MDQFTVQNLVRIIMPIAIALVYITLCSLLKEPGRQNINAVMIAGAGAAYLSGGFGPWEFAFLAVVTYCAYRGLRSYTFIGIGWLLHTGWDVLHHLYGNPIIPFAELSSFGCAICDPVLALCASLARHRSSRCYAGNGAKRPNSLPDLVGPARICPNRGDG